MGITSYSFIVADYVSPFLRNHFPVQDSYGVDGSTNISFDILDDAYGVDLSQLDVYINGSQAFSAPSTFLSPWNATGSSISTTTVDGYDGYNLLFVNSNVLSPRTFNTIEVVAKDFAGNILDEYWNFTTGTEISSVIEGEFEIMVLVGFGGPMTVNSDIFDASNYEFNNGMYARLAEVVDNKTIKLWVEFFHTSEEFELTVSSNILDENGKPLPSSYNNITFNPFATTANISNINGKIRTWHSSNIVQADSQRIYVAGTKGIDVFRKNLVSVTERWGQIFDSYNIMSMFVANFPSDLVITDTVPPFLANQVPIPGSSSSSVSSVNFAIVDANTAVEITSVTIYIDSQTAFTGGYSGWSNGYSGTVSVFYRQLNFSIVPPSAFTVGQIVFVRVVATDLLGNRLDETYQFLVESSSITDGWGGQQWGSSPWGGA